MLRLLPRPDRRSPAGSSGQGTVPRRMGQDHQAYRRDDQGQDSRLRSKSAVQRQQGHADPRRQPWSPPVPGQDRAADRGKVDLRRAGLQGGDRPLPRSQQGTLLLPRITPRQPDHHQGTRPARTAHGRLEQRRHLDEHPERQLRLLVQPSGPYFDQTESGTVPRHRHSR